MITDDRITGYKTWLTRIRVFSEKSGRIFIWPMIAACLAAAGWFLLFAFLDNKRHEVDSDALHEAEALAKTCAAHVERSIDTIDQILLHVKFEWELSGRRLSLESIAGRGLFPPTSDFNVAIADRAGNVVTGTGSHARRATVVDQPFFLVHKNSNLDILYIGDSGSGHTSNPRDIYLSRKLSATDGSFIGVVVVSVVPETFLASYDETILRKKGFLGLVDVKGRVGPARIGEKVYSEGEQALFSAPRFAFKSGSMLVDGERQFADHRARYVGWQTLDAYPTRVIVGLDQKDFLAQYGSYRTHLIQYASLSSAALLVATSIAMALSIRLAARRRQLELTQAAYRMATDEGIEGFYIFRPVRDKGGAVTDFKAIDCNSRGAEFFQLRRDELIDRNVSAFPQGMQADHLIRSLQDAMVAGSMECEMAISTSNAVPAKWLRLKIVRSIDNLAVRLSDISDSKAHVAELERRGNEDALTGLPNRHWANIYLPEAVESARSNHSMLAILFIDLDGFKAVNDSLGHEAGDELLRSAGRRLQLAVRPGDRVVRIGGDEFVVIIEGIEHTSDAAHVAERVIAAFSSPFRLQQGMQSVGTSIGISIFPEDGTDADTLLRNADIAMYSVKTSGKGNYCFYHAQLYETLCARMEMETELRHAIEQDQFVVCYQPRVDMSTGRISGMEALVRWDHPIKGIIHPVEFISLAEEAGVIADLGSLVIDKVCAQLADWEKAEHELVPVSINVSPRQFNEVDMADVLMKALSRHGIGPGLIEIELTESLMMGDKPETSSALNTIQQMGIKLLVDDFGTGYSSLSQLQRMDFDLLKVDQTFTARLEETGEGYVFFEAITTMAHALGMRVVAEGVETPGQVNMLRRLQCDEIQGFYISKPLTSSETQQMLPKRFLRTTA